MSRRPVDLLIEDIWDAIEKIERYLSGFDHDAFVKDDKTVDSVVRNLEIMGEAANRLPFDFKAKHRQINGVRSWAFVTGLFTIILVSTLRLFGRLLKRTCRS